MVSAVHATPVSRVARAAGISWIPTITNVSRITYVHIHDHVLVEFADVLTGQLVRMAVFEFMREEIRIRIGNGRSSDQPNVPLRRCIH